MLGLIVQLALAAAFVLKGNSLHAVAPGQKALGTRDAIRTALRNSNFLLLSAGFRLRLPRGVPGDAPAGRDRHLRLAVAIGAWSLAMLGLFNIVGSVSMGWAIGRWRMKSLLSLVYAARAVAVLAFLLAPKTGPVVLLFAAVMGLTFL